jgi:hypothetical protein
MPIVDYTPGDRQGGADLRPPLTKLDGQIVNIRFYTIELGTVGEFCVIELDNGEKYRTSSSNIVSDLKRNDSVFAAKNFLRVRIHAPARAKDDRKNPPHYFQKP